MSITPEQGGDRGRMPLNPTTEQFRAYVIAEIDDALRHSWVVSGDRRKLLQGLRTLVQQMTVAEVQKFQSMI